MSHLSRTRLRPPRLVKVLVLLAACSCSDGAPGDPVAPELDDLASPSYSLLAASDSIPYAAYGVRAPFSGAVAAAAASIVLPAASGFVVTFVDRECAAPGNVVSLTSPVQQTLLTSACQAAKGQSWSFPGPFPAGTTISFALQTGTGSPGGIRVGGAFPKWTVSFEDGSDNDFNDLIFEVAATDCPILSTPPSDPLLADPAVQRGLLDLWRSSNTTDPNQAKRFEQGGWIVERNGQRSVVPFGGNSNPQSCNSVSPAGELQALQQSGATILGFAHTHPHTPGAAVPTDGSCLGNKSPGKVFGDGPSLGDEGVMSGSPWPQYVVDANHVHTLAPGHKIGDPIAPPLSRNPACK